MKKLLATAIFAFLGAGTFAQTSQGTIVASGSVGFSKTTQDSDESQAIKINTSYFNITPSIGYMIWNGLEVGALIGYAYNSHEQVSDDDTFGVDYNTKTNS